LRETGIPAGATVEVVAVARDGIRVRDHLGCEIALSPRRHAAAWTVAAPRIINLAVGDRVLVRHNHRVAGLVNGEVLTLASRTEAGGWRARDARGHWKEIPADFRAFTHGYAVTSHKAQGRTCDEVIVCAARLDAKATYVAFSRARQRATGYMPDKAALFDALPASNRPRPAALDVWTSARSRRLRWARSVIERVHELLASIVPVPEVAAAIAAIKPTPAPRQSAASADESVHVHHTPSPAPAMRMRF
jgi:hypothetical protein